MATMLIYNMSGDRRAKMNMICMRHKIRIRPVAPEEFGLPLGALCGKTPAGDSAEVAPFEDEMIVMADFSVPLANAFLQSWRQMKQAPIRLKAVLTPTNVSWNAAQLHAELTAEEAAIREGGKAHQDSQADAAKE